MIATVFPSGGGSPTHTAQRGTPWWDVTNNKLYVNKDITNWQELGAGGGGTPTFDTAGSFKTDQVTAIAYKQMTLDIAGGRQMTMAKAKTSLSASADYDCLSNVGQQASPSASNGYSVGATKGFLRIQALANQGGGFLLTMPAGIPNYEYDRLPYMMAWVESVGTNGRVWIGFFSTNPGTSDDPTGFLAGFRYSGGVNGDRLSACTKNNGSINAQDTGVSWFPGGAPAKHLVEIVFRSTTQVDFYINGTLVNTATTEIPSGGMDEPPGMYLQADGSARSVDINFVYASQK